MENNSRINIVDDSFDALIRMAFAMRSNMLAAEDNPEPHPWAAFLADPDELAALARRETLSRIQAVGEARPVFMALTTKAVQGVYLMTMPGSVVEQAQLSSVLQVVVATAKVKAYWFSYEVWVASYDHSPTEKDVPPVDREDRHEATLIITASPQSFRVMLYDMPRNLEGKVNDLTQPKDITTHFDASNPLMSNLFEKHDAIEAIARRLRDRAPMR